MIKHNSPKGTVEVLEGRNVLKSAGWGEWGPEDVKELIQALIKLSGHLKPGKWGYMADPSQMDPILSKETSAEFVNLHVEMDKKGCSAIAFLDGRTAAIKQKSQRHHQSSGSDKMVSEHFRNEKEALDWFTDLGIN